MKIVFNTDQIYLHGGIEKTMATKANYLVNLPNVEVYILLTEQKKNSPCYPLDSKIKLIDLEINYNRNISYFSKENLIKAFKHFVKQRKFFKTLKPEVVISPNFNFDHYWLPFIASDAKVIKERHSSYFQDSEMPQNLSFLSKLKMMFNNRLDKSYDHIVVLNEDEKKYVNSGNAVVIPNAVLIPQQKAELNNKKIMAAGRIAPVKAFDQLILAWKIINENFPDWELHIYGEDYLGTQQQLQQLILNLNLEKSVSFKKSVDDLPKTMLDYSLYAMSSVTECFPMVLLESLSVGLPIVSYDCPNGPRNIVTDKEDGLLAKNKNPQDLADKIMLLINNEEDRKQMGVNAKNNCQRFEISEVMKLWCNLLNCPDV